MKIIIEHQAPDGWCISVEDMVVDTTEQFLELFRDLDKIRSKFKQSFSIEDYKEAFSGRVREIKGDVIKNGKRNRK